MSTNLKDHMRSNILGSLDSIKKLFNFSLATYGLIALGLINSLEILNKQNTDHSVEIFGITAYRHYFSLLFGLLFSAFMYVLFARIRLFKITIEKYQAHFQKEIDSNLITLYPWSASPFHQSRHGLRTFFGFIILGIIHLVWLAIVHFSTLGGPPREAIIETEYYRLIGVVDIVAFFVGLLFLFFIMRTIRKIRENLYYPEK